MSCSLPFSCLPTHVADQDDQFPSLNDSNPLTVLRPAALLQQNSAPLHQYTIRLMSTVTRGAKICLLSERYFTGFVNSGVFYNRGSRAAILRAAKTSTPTSEFMNFFKQSSVAKSPKAPALNP